MRKPRILKVDLDQAVEGDLHQQIEIELGQDTQRVARALRSDFPPSQPRDQRMKVARSDELPHEFKRRTLLGSSANALSNAISPGYPTARASDSGSASGFVRRSAARPICG